MLAAAVIVMLAEASTSVIADSPLAKAEQGYVQCYDPDDETKTCQSLATYKHNSDGSWDNTAVVLVSQKQPITLETVTPVRVKEGAVCGFIRKQDILDGKLRFNGRLLPYDKALPILTKLTDNMSGMINKEICTEYIEGTDDLIAKVKIGGVLVPMPEQRVRWVHLSDGYSVLSASVISGP